MLSTIRPLRPLAHDADSLTWLARTHADEGARLQSQAGLHTQLAEEARAAGKPVDADSLELTAKTSQHHATLLYSNAEKLQAQANASKTKWQRLRPGVKTAIIATVIFAEIISIPILLANIYMMCKHGTHHRLLPEGPLPQNSGLA